MLLRRWLALSIGLLALCGCGRPETPTQAPVQPANAPSVATQNPEPARKRVDPERKVPTGVVCLNGSPETIGEQHGQQLADEIKVMIREYVGEDAESGKLKAGVLARVQVAKASLPEWYRRELAACAKAAGVDEDVLLYAQCEGDIKSLGGCTSYVAYGEATSDGEVEIGRNFDYWGLESTARCAKVFAFVPDRQDGYAFVSVGWTGILGGWTFFNEKGLFASCNLGGFREKNPQGVPALVLLRMIAQKAATVDEAVALVKATPRMRGAALVLGQAGDPARGVPPRGVVIQFDAARVDVEEGAKGLAFHTSVRTDPEGLRGVLNRADRTPTEAIHWAGSSITLHSVAIRPREQAIWVAHGLKSRAHEGEYVKYDLNALLAR